MGQLAANELGTFDMSGNVWEWCWDIYGTYPSGNMTNPTGRMYGSTRVLRGGGWYNSAIICTVSHRESTYPTGIASVFGFRIVRVSL